MYLITIRSAIVQLQPANLGLWPRNRVQPSTFNLQPSTFNLPTFNLPTLANRPRYANNLNNSYFIFQTL
ncbi:MAG: hypothetical protein F6K56_27275 [Moorea sp. SIO3G5]|nr:hypothetical protein [Moorena sp. SIO3G5]